MARNTIKDIIENFNRQLGLYHDMAELSASQLAYLEQEQAETGSGKLNAILEQRQSLMTVISSLNEENKKLQEQALAELDIDEFILRKLRHEINADDFAKLQEIIDDLSKVLKYINETDGRNQALMMKLRKTGGAASDTVKSTEASKMYRQAMENRSK